MCIPPIQREEGALKLKSSTGYAHDEESTLNHPHPSNPVPGPGPMSVLGIFLLRPRHRRGSRISNEAR